MTTLPEPIDHYQTRRPDPYDGPKIMRTILLAALAGLLAWRVLWWAGWHAWGCW